MRQLEEFGISLASNMVYIKRNEYRGKRSTSTLPSYSKVEDNLRTLLPVDCFSASLLYEHCRLI